MMYSLLQLSEALKKHYCIVRIYNITKNLYQTILSLQEITCNLENVHPFLMSYKHPFRKGKKTFFFKFWCVLLCKSPAPFHWFYVTWKSIQFFWHLVHWCIIKLSSMYLYTNFANIISTIGECIRFSHLRANLSS